MGSCWSIPGIRPSVHPTLADLAASAEQPVDQYQPLHCPSCRDYEHLRVRSSDDRWSWMLCTACKHTWKESGDICRVLVVRIKT